jgi:immune inhibitor A
MRALGATACTAHPGVLKDIAKQLEQHNVIPAQELQIARLMGIVTTSAVARPGFNDGIFSPYELSTGRPGSPRVISKAAVASVGSKRPKKRKVHAIALLVDFSDNKGKRRAKDFQNLLFDKANPNSMSNFYRQLSYGALELTGEVVGYVRAPQPYSYYTASESGTGTNYPNNTPGLLHDALTIFCGSDNLARFDTDYDGFVDAIFLIHAGRGAEAERNPTKRKKMIWSHTWTLPQPFIHQGVKVFAYSTEPEDGRVGVFSHEFGHLLGLPDLYDTTFRSHGIGDWCLMAAGSWGRKGNRPSRMSCWCLSKLGWIKPKVVTGKKSIRLNTLEVKKTECYRLWKKGATGRNISFWRIVRPKVSTPRFPVQALPSGISTSGNQTITIRWPISWHCYRRMGTRIWNYSRIQAMPGIFSRAIKVSRRLTTIQSHQHDQIGALLHA